MYTSKLKIKTSSVNVRRSVCWWPGPSYNTNTNKNLYSAVIHKNESEAQPYRRAGHRKSPPTVTAETIARHDKKTLVSRVKVLSGGDTGYRLAEVDEVLGCLVVQTVEHHEAKAWTRPAPVHWANVVQYVRVATSHGRTCVYRWPHERRHSAWYLLLRRSARPYVYTHRCFSPL